MDENASRSGIIVITHDALLLRPNHLLQLAMRCTLAVIVLHVIQAFENGLGHNVEALGAGIVV